MSGRGWWAWPRPTCSVRQRIWEGKRSGLMEELPELPSRTHSASSCCSVLFISSASRPSHTCGGGERERPLATEAYRGKSAHQLFVIDRFSCFWGIKSCFSLVPLAHRALCINNLLINCPNGFSPGKFSFRLCCQAMAIIRIRVHVVPDATLHCHCKDQE